MGIEAYDVMRARRVVGAADGIRLPVQPESMKPIRRRASHSRLPNVRCSCGVGARHGIPPLTSTYNDIISALSAIYNYMKRYGMLYPEVPSL